MSSQPIIIILEPDPTFSSVLRVEFTRMDFTVLLAGDGTQAEEYADLVSAHMVVLDVSRRDLGAYEACARVRRLSGYAGRPIVLTTNAFSGKVKAAAQAAGGTILLAKPYSVDDLFRTLTPHLPADDRLLTARARQPGMGESQEWRAAPPPRFTDNSALTRNGLLLPIVRGRGVGIPVIHKS